MVVCWSGPDAIGVLVSIAVVSAIDIISDVSAGAAFQHVALEATIVLIGLLGAALMGRRLITLLRHSRAKEAEAKQLAESLRASKKEAAHWREEANFRIRLQRVRHPHRCRRALPDIRSVAEPDDRRRGDEP